MWDERYSTQGYVFGVEPNRFVAAELAGLPPCRVLDLGSGQGRNAVWLAAQGHDVTAVDLSPVATEQARRLAEEAGVVVRFVAANLSTWEPEPAVFDLVLLSYLQLVPETRKLVHGAAVRALAAGGTLFLIAHHRDNLEHGVGGPQSPEYLYTEDVLRADFAALTIERLERVLRPVDRADVSGDAIDVLLIARREGDLEP
jgi:SAM-dependent methyltransferase